MPKKVKIELDFDIQEEVYLKTDPEQLKRIVREIRLLPFGLAAYVLGCGETESIHYAFEMSETPDFDTSGK